MNDDPRTPSLEDILDAAQSAAVYGLRVMLPGRVESYDAATHRCSVTPLIMDGDELESGEPTAVALPVLNDVPVYFPGGGGIRIRWPIVKGDEVMLIFASSSIARFKRVGGARGPVDPADDRRHDINDAYAVPTYKVAAPEDAAAMIEFTSGGLIKVGGNEPLVRKSEFDGHTHDAGTLTAPSGGGSVTGVTGGADGVDGTPKLRG